MRCITERLELVHPLKLSTVGPSSLLFHSSVSLVHGSPIHLSYKPTNSLQSPTVDFDTGSADLWVPSPNSKSSHTKFSIQKSSTIETSTAEWGIVYGTGESEGYLARDTVSVGDYVVTKQIFALANTSAPVIEALPCDGLMGMGFSTIATYGAPTFFENLITQGNLPAPLFSFYLQRARDVTSKSTGTIGGGELCIGCVDSSKYTGSMYVFHSSSFSLLRACHDEI